jgi:hypothetical protein
MVLVDSRTGRFACSGFLVDVLLRGSKARGPRHRAASAIAQQARGCLVLKASRQVCEEGQGALDVFLGTFETQEPLEPLVAAAATPSPDDDEVLYYHL